jgi:hypothetical protein
LIIRHEFTVTSHNDKLVIKEELHLPPIFIEQGNVLCAEVEVVRVVDGASMKPWRIIDNSSDNTGILLLILLPW